MRRRADRRLREGEENRKIKNNKKAKNRYMFILSNRLNN